MYQYTLSLAWLVPDCFPKSRLKAMVVLKKSIYITEPSYYAPNSKIVLVKSGGLGVFRTELEFMGKMIE